jgi:hypothetical protein
MYNNELNILSADQAAEPITSNWRQATGNFSLQSSLRCRSFLPSDLQRLPHKRAEHAIEL